jgi:TolB protein
MTERVNRIALINPNGEVETISPDGTQHRILTQGDRFFQFPAWSPNGARIAAVGGNRERAGVFVLEDEDLDRAFIQQHEPRVVYESDSDAPIYLYWSPDSRHVSFLTSRPQEDAMGLRVAPAGVGLETSGDFDRLVAIGRPCFWDWSADGKRILLHTGMNTDDDAQLKYIDPFNPANGNASIAKPGLFQAPGIARSGRYWAFAQVNRSGEMQLVVDGRADSNRMTVAHQGVAALSWSPTRDQLAYISPSEPVRTYYGPLRLLDAATGKVQMLTDDIVLAFFWSPNGRSIAYFTVANVAEQLWDTIMPDPEEAARDGGFRGQEDDDEEAEFDEARVLRLNLWCVDVDDGEHRLISTFEPVDLFVNQFLPFFDQYALSHRLWSPDSSSIVLPMVTQDEHGEDHARVYVVPMLPRMGRPRPIADGVMAFWSQQ